MVCVQHPLIVIRWLSLAAFLLCLTGVVGSSPESCAQCAFSPDETSLLQISSTVEHGNENVATEDRRQSTLALFREMHNAVQPAEATSADETPLSFSSVKEALIHGVDALDSFAKHPLTSIARFLRGPPATVGTPDGNTQSVFEEIYGINMWGNNESLSGRGSTVKHTELIRSCLGDWMKKYSVNRLLDIPCGDGNWQRFIPGIEDVSYFGYDISPTAVKLAEEKNADRGNMQFGVLDLVNTDPPLEADMIIIKEVIQHLPLDMGVKMLKHAKAAGIRLLAVTSNSTATNRNVTIGAFFRGPNAQAPPFNLDPPVEVCTGADLMLFDLHRQGAIR